jgi:hypothetical protein
MIGFILAGAIFAAGFYYGQKQQVPDQGERKETPEDEKAKREKISKGVNNIATYAGMKGRDKS